MRLLPALLALLLATPAALRAQLNSSTGISEDVTSPTTPSGERRALESFQYFSPATFELTVTREQDPAPTAKGVANPVAVTRLTARDLLAPVVAEFGGKLADWSLVAYSDSETFEDVADLALLARNTRTRTLAPVAALRLDTLGFLDARSSAYAVTRTENGDLLSATFDQKYLVTCEQTVAGGTLSASGSLTHALSFGPLKAARQSLRVFKPGTLRLVLTGTHTTESGTGVAELVLTLASPRLVPLYGAPIIVISDPTELSPQ